MHRSSLVKIHCTEVYVMGTHTGMTSDSKEHVSYPSPLCLLFIQQFAETSKDSSMKSLLKF